MVVLNNHKTFLVQAQRIKESVYHVYVQDYF